MPIILSVLKFNQLIRFIPIWAFFFLVSTITISSINSNVSFANTVIFLSLVLQLPLCFFMIGSLKSHEFLQLVKHLNLVCGLQIFIAIIQIFIWKRPGDSVNGSMLGDYHGTHIMPFMIYMAILLNWRLTLISKFPLLIIFVLNTFIAIKADAKLVLIAVVIFLMISSIGIFFSSDASISFKFFAIFSIPILITAVISSGFIQYSKIHWGYELGNAFKSKNIILEEYFNPISSYRLENSILTGAGPTQTVSRSAIIAQANADGAVGSSPLTASIPKYYSSYTQTTGKFNIGPISSISQPISSIVGVLGDIGVIGCISFSVMTISSIRTALRNGRHRKKLITLLIAIFLMPLSYFNTFLEFPQAVFPFVIAVFGFSREESTDNYV